MGRARKATFQARVVSFMWGRAQKQRFQARVISFMWGRTRKGLVLGTGGGNTMGSSSESNVFRHGWRKYHGIVPGKQRFQAWVVSFMCGRTRNATFSGTGGENTIRPCPNSGYFGHE